MAYKEYQALENQVIQKLEGLDISWYEHDGKKFSLQKDGWHVEIRGPMGLDDKVGGLYANQLSMMVIDSEKIKNADPNLTDGNGYEFVGNKVEALYASLSEKLKARKEQSTRLSENESKKKEASDLLVLRTFLNK